MTVFAVMYQPYVVISKRSNAVMIPALSKSRYPVAVFVDRDGVRGFYRLGDRYYVELVPKLQLKYIATVPALPNSIPLPAKETDAPIPLEKDSVVMIAVDDVAPENEEGKLSSTVRICLPFVDEPFVVPVRHLYQFCTAVYLVANRTFPHCTEALAPLLVGEAASKDVTEEAAEICGKVFAKQIKRCTTLRAIAAAGVCVAVVVRRRGHPLTLADVAMRLGVPSKYVRLAYLYTMKKLGLGRRDLAIDTEAYIRRLVSAFIDDPDLREVIASRAVEIYRKVREQNLGGKDPKGIAAACVYLAANLTNVKITQKQLSNVVGVTEVTLRKRIHELRHLLYSLS